MAMPFFPFITPVTGLAFKTHTGYKYTPGSDLDPADPQFDLTMTTADLQFGQEDSVFFSCFFYGNNNGEIQWFRTVNDEEEKIEAGESLGGGDSYTA